MFPTAWLLTPVSEEYAAKKKAKALCRTYRCRRPAVRYRPVCEICKSRLFRLKNRLYYAWDCLRSSARKRGIGFELTLEEFRSFCEKTGYLQTKGIDAGCSTVNRIKASLPYRADNIELMEHRENVSRRHDEPRDPY